MANGDIKQATLIKEGEEPRVVGVDTPEAQAAFAEGFTLPEAAPTPDLTTIDSTDLIDTPETQATIDQARGTQDLGLQAAMDRQKLGTATATDLQNIEFAIDKGLIERPADIAAAERQAASIGEQPVTDVTPTVIKPTPSPAPTITERIRAARIPSAQIRQEAIEAAGVGVASQALVEAQRKVADLSTQIQKQGIIDETEVRALAGQGRGITSGLIQAQQAQLTDEQRRDLALVKLDLNNALIQEQIAQGAFDRAESIARDIANDTKEDIDREVDLLLLEGQIQENEAAELKQQSEFERNLALEGFVKIEGPAGLAGLTENQILRIPNPITGVQDIFKKPEVIKDRDTQIIQSGGRAILVDRQTGETIQDFGLTAAPKITRAVSIPTRVENIPPGSITDVQLQQPTFEQFIVQKEQELQQTLTPEGREDLRSEFEALTSNVEKNNIQAGINQLSPTAREAFRNPQLFFTLTGTERNSIFSEIASAGLDTSRLLEGKKQRISQTQVNDLGQARLAKRNVERIQELINDLGKQGPAVGRFRSANPFDDKVVELNQIITQTVPGLARGIFKEVGVLTDADVVRYTSTIANPNLTKSQALTATRNLLDLIDDSLDIQVTTFESLGFDTGEFNELIKTDRPNAGINISDEELINKLSPEQLDQLRGEGLLE